MSYTFDEIQADIKKMSADDFYVKYILRSSCWYFENILASDKKSASEVADDFREIVSRDMGINFHNVALVGSAKLGYSLSPRKRFLEFSQDGMQRKESDIDIAIISNGLFDMFWELLRKSFRPRFAKQYDRIALEVFRGYINEKHLNHVVQCRSAWNNLALPSKKNLKNTLFIKHEISYRIYRSWEDVEDYQLHSLNAIKQELSRGTIS